MNSSLSSPSPFEIPYIKIAEVVKTEIKPFLHNNVYNYTQQLSFENEPYSLETIPLIREHLDTYLFYIRHRSTTASTEYPSFQITLPQHETSSIQSYRRTINPINLQIPIKEVFYAFLIRVKEYNLALENPKYSTNALEELDQYIHIFKVEDIERIITTQNITHHWLQADILRIQNFLYQYFKDITLNEQTIPQTKVISLFPRKYFRFNYQLLWSEQDQPAFAAFQNHFTADECLPFIINKQNEHPYFFKPDKVTQQTMDLISFDPRSITEKIFMMIIDRIVMNKIFKNNISYLPTITIILKKMKIIMKNTYLKIKMKIVMKILYSTQMKTMQVSIPLQNPQLQHKMHHKLKHQQPLTLLDIQLELLPQDKIHMIHNHT